ncbi:putative oxidoreductase [Mycolicibacterium cyprinidarum]|uniref:Oxidoreductase n=1 Tax=Mycolicibacterium cyprinidarum TaxID=2860311 RepID=A0ABQ4VBT8_9MYCO|nr:putative oxidoreductase [Mycolicibacterium sp. NGTWSNA01]GJF17712.1 putative oxidoreductase [Mycolicibacterium sp. NGTWS0302]
MGERDGTDAFDSLVARLKYPMFVVTTATDQRPAGCLVGFTSQTSIHPPRFLVGLSRKNHTFTVAQDADHLAVHVLPRESRHVAELFGGATGDTTDKFAQCAWHEGPAGMPILDAASAWFVGAVIRRFDLGDHVGHLLEPVAGSAPDDLGELITSVDVRDLDPGHEA